jgi:Cytochrome P460
MKPKSALAIAVLTLAGVTAYLLVAATGQADESSAPAYVTKIPAGYRDWKVVSVAHEAGKLNSLGIVLGNDVAIKAFRAGTLPFPDGRVFGDKQSYVPGPPTNVQFEVKDSKKYAATGGWGFGHFNADGKPADVALLKTCFPCHEPAKATDLIYTHYTP